MLLVFNGSVKTPPLEMFEAGLERPWAVSHNSCLAAWQLRTILGELPTLGSGRTRQETHADLHSPKNHLYCTGTVPWECAITGAAIEEQWALSCQNSSFEGIQLPWILIHGTALPNSATKEKLESLTPTFSLLARGTWIGKNNWKGESSRTLSEGIVAQA